MDSCRTACFTVIFDPPAHGHNHQNFFHGLTATVLRSLGQIAAKFEKGRDAELLTLPLRNFHADELRNIAQMISSNVLAGGLSDSVETRLAALRKRVRPRRQSSHKALYAVDDRNRFFVYGHEHHSRPETGGAHTSHCILSATFRFGRKIDSSRHYNVSETEGDHASIAGEFTNCHDVCHAEQRNTHLNMFANDMYY